MTKQASADHSDTRPLWRFLAALHQDRRALDGKVVVPGDDEWDDARRPWQLAVDQNPTAVVLAGSEADVVVAVRAANAAGMDIAPQASGHHARLLGPLDNTVLLRTAKLDAIDVDAQTHVARIGAGVLWGAVTDAAAEVGLAGLAGSSRDVGVVGYVLGGGLSWLARSHGLAANHVLAAEVVTADGVLRRIDAEHHADLFWALRGGGGSFAVVTALEIRLFPLTEVHAGTLYWPLERAAEVLHAWRCWSADIPEAVASFGRMLRLPENADFPAPIRGRELVAIGVVSQLDDAATNRLLAPLRALYPETDTVARTAIEDLGQLHMDPSRPSADTGDGLQVGELTPAALDALLEVGGPRSGCSLLSVELRQLGGAASSRAEGGALSGFDAAFALYAVGMTSDAASAAVANADLDSIHKAMEPWRAPAYYPNFCERHRPPEALHGAETLARLRRVKEIHDPDNLLRAVHPVR